MTDRVLTSHAGLAGIIVAAWYGIGVALVIYLSARHPASVRDTATVLEDVTIAPAPQRT